MPVVNLTNILRNHYCDVIMGTMTSQITVPSVIYSTVCSGADQRKHQSSASLAFVQGIHRWPVNSPHKRPVTREMFPFDDVIMTRMSAKRDISTLWTNPSGHTSKSWCEFGFEYWHPNSRPCRRVPIQWNDVTWVTYPSQIAMTAQSLGID